MKLTDLSHEEQKHVLSKIKELAKSDGWKFLQQIMSAEREEFIRKMVAPNSTLDEKLWHYNRGIMEASFNLMTLPQNAVTQLTGLIQFHEKVAESKTPMPKPTTETTPTTH